MLIPLIAFVVARIRPMKLACHIVADSVNSKHLLLHGTHHSSPAVAATITSIQLIYPQRNGQSKLTLVAVNYQG